MRIVPPNKPASDANDRDARAGDSAARPEDASPEVHTTAAPDAHTNLVGHVLADRYRLRKLIGEGGMGSVYQAEHITIGRKLAVKVLSPEFCDSPEVVARFLQEARTASMLHHEHIVDITDFGYTKQGLAFLTMEYLEGEDLATLLQREGRQPWSRMRRIVLQVCRALHAAHEKGIVHRDMKPDNCFRIKRGGNSDFIKLLDFGIAKVIADGQFGGRQDKPKMATEAGTLLGTPEYMAPEIARDQGADARVDIYSLGILMYEMLTGSVPFKGQTFMATVAMQMVDEPQPPSQRAPDAAIPPSIEAVILRALHKDPNERYQTIQDLAEAIIEADKVVRATAQALPALRFDSGEHPSPTGEISLHGAPLTQTRPPGTTGSHTPLPPHVQTPVQVQAPLDDLEDPSELQRSNPYRVISILLLLLVGCLGGALWYLMDRGGTEGLFDGPDDEPGLHAGDETPAVISAGAAKAAGATETDTGETEDDTDTGEAPSKPDKPVKKHAPANVDATEDDMKAFLNLALPEVNRCASSNDLPRQRVSVLFDADAGTGKIRAKLESPRSNAGFTTCVEKALARKRFKKGRNYKTFHGNFDL